jgi:hypothetical protein
LFSVSVSEGTEVIITAVAAEKTKKKKKKKGKKVSLDDDVESKESKGGDAGADDAGGAVGGQKGQEGKEEKEGKEGKEGGREEEVNHAVIVPGEGNARTVNVDGWIGLMSRFQLNVEEAAEQCAEYMTECDGKYVYGGGEGIRGHGVLYSKTFLNRIHNSSC